MWNAGCQWGLGGSGTFHSGRSIFVHSSLNKKLQMRSSLAVEFKIGTNSGWKRDQKIFNFKTWRMG